MAPYLEIAWYNRQALLCSPRYFNRLPSETAFMPLMLVVLAYHCGGSRSVSNTDVD